MAIVVEDGTVVSGANSYVTEGELTTFATARGVTLTTDEEQLLIRAMDYIESLGYIGTKKERDQSLQWPRLDVYIDGYYWDSDEIPQELKDGLMHTAVAIDQGNDPLQDAPRKTIREKVGELEVQYSESSTGVAVNKKILNTLWKLLKSSTGNVLTVSKG